ncbi:hypothetical protein J6590_072750 [Homalodisca vitripennis]|nr:hypothetical protein J6590_072750 [Homalodisca vitripennis]
MPHTRTPVGANIMDSLMSPDTVFVISAAEPSGSVSATSAVARTTWPLHAPPLSLAYFVPKERKDETFCWF